MISSSESPPTFNSRLGPNRVPYVRCTTPRKLSAYAAAVIAKLRDLAPYAVIELVLPGGSLMALLLWLYRSHKARHASRKTRRGNHIFQSALDFRPAARLQAAIGIDPKLLGCKHLASLREERNHFLYRRHARGMNVIDARADVGRVAVADKSIQQFHLGAGGFDGNDVRIHGRNGGHDI